MSTVYIQGAPDPYRFETHAGYWIPDGPHQPGSQIERIYCSCEPLMGSTYPSVSTNDGYLFEQELWSV